MYVQNGEMYYTGLISGEPVGKSVPESNEQIIDIPNGYDYCVIQYGIVCFSDDTIICYSL